MKRLNDGNKNDEDVQSIPKFDVEANMKRFVLNKPTYYIFVEHNWMTFVERDQ